MRIDEHWYRKSLWLWLLWPIAVLFCLLVVVRRRLYRLGLLPSEKIPVPVIVVGNITVGGSGKTPLVLWLAQFLRQKGYRPGLISRGYGGEAAVWPQTVHADSDPKVVGDEALLLARRSACPMVVGPDRVAAARQLLAEHDVNVILSDDGMQHYRLARDIEIAVLDGERRLANGLCLPAGPLREPRARLRSVDFIVTNGHAGEGEWSMQLEAGEAIALAGDERRPLSAFSGASVHAVAGIGNPGRFFDMLRGLGLEPIEHAFPDHHPYAQTELDFSDGAPVLMTEKDAVKYFDYAGNRHWYLPVNARLSDDFGESLLATLEKVDG